MGNNLLKLGVLAAACLCCAMNAGARQNAEPAAQSITVKGVKNPSAWFRAESAHFIAYSSSRNEDMTKLLGNLEKLDHLLRIYTRDYRSGGAKQKLTLYFHDRDDGQNTFAPDQPADAVGLYTSCGSGVQGYGIHLQRVLDSGNAKLAREPLNASLSYIFEAYARHFLYRNTDIRAPASFIDGFAQYFSSVRFSDNQFVAGRVPSSAGRYLYFVDQGAGASLDYQQVFDPEPKPDRGYKAEPAQDLELMSTSWLLMHYMLSSAENRERMSKYLDLVHHDMLASKAFERSFGLRDADLDTTLWRYRRKGFEVLQVELPSLPVAQVGFTSLPKAATEFLLADAALKSCPLPKAGEALLRTVSAQAASHPAGDYSALTLSRAQIDWGNPADALPYLSAAALKDPANYDAAYLLGRANLRLHAQHGKKAGAAYLQAAQGNLARARALSPLSAEAAFASYQAALSGQASPDQAALEGAVTAWKNAHEVNTFARSAALVYAYTGRESEADQALTLLAHNSRAPELASWAKTWRSRLAAGVGRAELLAEMRRDPAPQAVFKEWTLAGEDLMKTVEYNAGLEKARGYLEIPRMSPSTGLEFSRPQRQ